MLRDMRDFGVQPVQISMMRSAMRVYGPVFPNLAVLGRCEKIVCILVQLRYP